jgi:hypothetical protein
LNENEIDEQAGLPTHCGFPVDAWQERNGKHGWRVYGATEGRILSLSLSLSSGGLGLWRERERVRALAYDILEENHIKN